MSRKPFGLVLGSRGIAWALCGCLALGTVVMAGSKQKRVISKPKFDPSAERIALFEGLDNEVLSAKVLPKDEFGGQVFIENLTDKPLTVELPPSIVAVQVLPQAAGGGGDFGSNSSSNSGSGNGGGGQQQSMGGGMMGGGMMGGGMMGGGGGFGGGGGGGGFFSIPAGQVVRVPFTSVCLEHGKKPPRPGMNYKLVRPEVYTDSPALQELIKLVASGKLNKQAAQAAVWHVANNMSWQDLMAKKYDRVGSEDTPYFSHQELAGAEQIVALARQKVADRDETAPQEPVVRDRVTGQVVNQ